MLNRSCTGPNDALDLIGGAGIGGAVGDVELDGVDLRAALFQLGDGLIERVLAHIGDDHLAARLGEDLGLAEPGAAAAAGDERHLAREILHVDPPRSHKLYPPNAPYSSFPRKRESSGEATCYGPGSPRSRATTIILDESGLT